MNHYQKLAALLIRLLGAVLAVVGMMGPVYVGFLVALGNDVPEYGTERWAGSVVWATGGVLLIVFSQKLGGLFGRGLD